MNYINNNNIIDLNVGKHQTYKTINEALENCLKENTQYNINIYSGIYEEFITLPENCILNADKSSHVIIKFPSLDDSNINSLITCNHNTSIRNINLEINNNLLIESTDNDQQIKWIGINSQNKNNICIENVIIYQSSNNLLSLDTIGINIYGGEYHILKNIDITFSLGFGILTGILFDNVKDVSLKYSTINISSPTKKSLGIVIKNCMDYNNILLSFSNIKISNSENNIGIYGIKSSFNLNYSNILINSESNFSYGIYLTCIDRKNYINSEDIESIDNDLDTLFIKSIPNNIIVSDNKLIFNNENTVIDDDIINLVDNDLQLTFIDLGYEENDIIQLGGDIDKYYKIVEVKETEILFEPLIKNSKKITSFKEDLDAINSEILITKIYKIILCYNTISIENILNNDKNNVIFVEDIDISYYNIVDNFNNLLGPEINNKDCLVENKINKYDNSVNLTLENEVNISVGSIIIRSDNLNEYLGKISDIEKSKTFLGIYSHFNNETKNHNIITQGECFIWVTNINGNIELGDYITTSQLKGIGILQEDDVYHNYTIGKCVQQVNWDEAIEFIEYKDSLFAKMLLKILITTA